MATPIEGRPISSRLALATFDSAWQRIAHTHYDTTFRGVDWRAVGAELRPRAADAKTYEELRAIVRDMLSRLGESHYSLIPGDVAGEVRSGGREDGGEGDIGLELRIADGAVVVSRIDPGGPAAAAGVRTGWVMEAVDGRSLAEGLAKVESLEGSAHRLALTQFLWSINGALEGDPGSTVTLRALDGGNVARDLTLMRRTRPGEPVKFGNLPTLVTDITWNAVPVGDACVGVIRFNVWMTTISPVFDRAMDALRGCTGIVIDLRGNPGGVAGMVMGVAGHFLNTRVPLGELRTRTGELNLVANPRTVSADGRSVQPFAGPLAILIDPLSVSTSEIFTAGLQAAGRARVFGETSAGQALPAIAVKLPNDDVLMHVVADLTVPGGQRVEGRGVVPDQPVPLTRAALLAGEDPVLRAALQWIVSPRTDADGHTNGESR